MQEAIGMIELSSVGIGYQVQDARALLVEDASDIVQNVKILDLSPGIPNDTVAFSPDFPQDLKGVIIDGLMEYASSEGCENTICNGHFYSWDGLEPVYSRDFNGPRMMVDFLGTTLDDLDY